MKSLLARGEQYPEEDEHCFYPGDGALKNYSDRALYWIWNDKRPSRAGNQPNAGIVDGMATSQAESACCDIGRRKLLVRPSFINRDWQQ
jgi:hypothetical protein